MTEDAKINDQVYTERSGLSESQHRVRRLQNPLSCSQSTHSSRAWAQHGDIPQKTERAPHQNLLSSAVSEIQFVGERRQEFPSICQSHREVIRSRSPSPALNRQVIRSLSEDMSSTNFDSCHEVLGSALFAIRQEEAVLANEGEPSTQETTVIALRTTIEEMKSVGCAEILTDCIMSAMNAHTSNEQVQLLCLATIVDEFDDESFDSTVFVATSGDVCVTEALNRFPASLEVQVLGCSALDVLATNEFNRKDLICRGACTYL